MAVTWSPLSTINSPQLTIIKNYQSSTIIGKPGLLPPIRGGSCKFSQKNHSGTMVHPNGIWAESSSSSESSDSWSSLGPGAVSGIYLHPCLINSSWFCLCIAGHCLKICFKEILVGTQRIVDPKIEPTKTGSWSVWTQVWDEIALASMGCEDCSVRSHCSVLRGDCRVRRKSMWLSMVTSASWAPPGSLKSNRHAYIEAQPTNHWDCRHFSKSSWVFTAC